MTRNPMQCAALAAVVVSAGCGSGSVAEPPVGEPADGPQAAIGATSGARGSAQERPWRMRATVATTPAPPPAGCLQYFTSVIEGTATHAGRLSGVGSTCVTSAIQPDPNPPFLPAGPPPYLTAEFTNPLWTLTAANGDEIWITTVRAVVVISLANGALRAEDGEQEIIGGTGRFEGATGQAKARADNPDGQGPDDFESVGWIRFNAASQARN